MGGIFLFTAPDYLTVSPIESDSESYGFPVQYLSLAFSFSRYQEVISRNLEKAIPQNVYCPEEGIFEGTKFHLGPEYEHYFYRNRTGVWTI